MAKNKKEVTTSTIITIDELKSAITERRIRVSDYNYGSDFTCVVYPKSNDAETEPIHIKYDVKEYVSLSECGAIVREALDICYSEKFGYKAYLVNFAICRSFMKYFTNFPVTELTYEEMNDFLVNDDTNMFKHSENNLSSLAQYNEIVTSAENEISYKQQKDVHKYHFLEEIDNVLQGLINEFNTVENKETIGLFINAVKDGINKNVSSIKMNSNDDANDDNGKE